MGKFQEGYMLDGLERMMKGMSHDGSGPSQWSEAVGEKRQSVTENH